MHRNRTCHTLRAAFGASLLVYAVGCGGSDSAASDTADVKASSLGVELKVTIRSDQIDAASSALGLQVDDAEARDVYFYDTPWLDLDAAGIILRARKVYDGDDDSTVKLRPVIASEIASSWLRQKGFKCEIDRTSSKSVTSCSFSTVQDPGEIDDVADGDRDIDKLFSSNQEWFLATYGDVDVDWSWLAVLGPVDALVWRLTPDEVATDVVVELWTLPDDTRILEVSTKTSQSQAAAAAGALAAYLEGLGLDASGQDETKTRAALDYFASTF